MQQPIRIFIVRDIYGFTTVVKAAHETEAKNLSCLNTDCHVEEVDLKEWGHVIYRDKMALLDP